VLENWSRNNGSRKGTQARTNLSATVVGPRNKAFLPGAALGAARRAKPE